MSLSVGQMDAPLKIEWFGGEKEIFFFSHCSISTLKTKTYVVCGRYIAELPLHRHETRILFIIK